MFAATLAVVNVNEPPGSGAPCFTKKGKITALRQTEMKLDSVFISSFPSVKPDWVCAQVRGDLILFLLKLQHPADSGNAGGSI